MFRGFFNDSFFETPGSAFGHFFDQDPNFQMGGMRHMLQGPDPLNNPNNQMAPPGAFNDHSMMMMNPFASFENVFNEMNNMMSASRSRQFFDSSMMDMEPNNGFGFSTMKVQTYSNDGSGQPKTYEAQKSTRFAPGGVRQVQKSVRDSEAGVEKMSIGRHLGDRGHVITKMKDHKSGCFEENQDFHGFAEEEEPMFSQDWQKATQQYGKRRHHNLPLRPNLPNHGNQLDQGRNNALRSGCFKPDRLALEDA